MLPSDKLRFRNALTFAEEGSSTKRDRALEWRRSFNAVTYIGRSPTVEHIYSVNDVDYLDEARDADNSEDVDNQTTSIRPNSSRTLRLEFQVAQDDLRDAIYFTQETERSSGLYTLTRPKGGVRILFTDKPATQRRGPFGSGAYAGLAFRSDFESGEDYLCIDVSVPSTHLQEIAYEIEKNPSLELHVTIAIQSFSYEVDDALREWYHPRNLFIHGSAAPAGVVNIRAKPPTPNTTAEKFNEDETELEVISPTPEVEESPHLHSVPSKADSNELGGIRLALWAIVVLLAIDLAK